MGRESEIVIEHAIALSDMGKNTGRRLYPTHDEIPSSPSVFMSRMGDKKATNSKTGCVRNRNSCGTTHNGEVPTTTNDAFKCADQRKENP